MAELFARIWEVAGATGGTLALAFIVLLAAGLVLLAGMFVGAAVVVLERFARQVRRMRSVLLAVLLFAGALTLVAIDVEVPGVFERGEELASALPLAFGAAFTLVSLATAGAWLLLRFLSQRALARAGVLVLVVGLALAVRVPPIASLDLAARSALGGLGQALLAALGAVALLGVAPLALAGILDLRGSAEWFIASRYLVAKRRQTFISVITGICVAGVAAGVWLIITVLSVMNGFERTWREEIIGNRAHFTVQSGLGPFGDYQAVLERVLAQPGVTGGSPFVQAEGMVRGEGGEIVGVRLQGIDPVRVGDVTDLRKDLVDGSLEALIPAPAADGEAPDPGIVVGDSLAGALGVRVGDPLLLISPFGGPPTPLGASPRLMRFQ
ncbi:MAG: lolE, partial [Deltaproteobacteria bacterium]|nr:lolE [Deltaproteobacteria bacterium]